MELTREQAIVEHRKMWRWLAENPEKSKGDYVLDELIKKGINIKGMINQCFLCTYTGAHCESCPLDWGSATNCCDEGNASLFKKWIHARSIEEKAKLARQIAELPERTEE